MPEKRKFRHGHFGFYGWVCLYNRYVSHGMQGLKAQFLSDEKDFDAFWVAGTSGDDDLVTEAIRGKAVRAYAGDGTGCLQMQAYGIGRAGLRADALDGTVHVLYNFVHAHNQHDMCRSLYQAGDPVAIAVDIDQFAL